MDTKLRSKRETDSLPEENRDPQQNRHDIQNSIPLGLEMLMHYHTRYEIWRFERNVQVYRFSYLEFFVQAKGSQFNWYPYTRFKVHTKSGGSS